MRPVAPGATAFTICALNYLPQACVLAESLAAHHPGQRLTAVLLDDREAPPSPSAHLDLVRAADILDARSWAHKICFYDVLELATSIKPECFLHFLSGHEAAFYFDPDIRFFAPLPVLDRWSPGEASAILTPHILHPLPDDGRRPDNLAILRAGEYNLGFAGFRRDPEAIAFLEWWAGTLDRLCLADWTTGVFTDQKWVNFATSFMSRVHVSRNLGWNVAYWNLHERIPVRDAGQWQVRTSGGQAERLCFYHFSGYSPDAPTCLSKHEDRFGTRPPGDAAMLLADYAAALRAAGHGAMPGAALPSPRFAAGMAWDPVCRHLYRAALDAGVDLGDPLKDPDFLAWAGGSEPGDHVNRYVRTLLRLRGDVGASFDDGRNRAGLRHWLRGSGSAELGIDHALLDRLGAGIHLPGVHYVGYLRAHLGVAEAARGSIAALRDGGVVVQEHDISHLAGRLLGAYAGSAAGLTPDGPAIAILAVNADVLPDVLPRLPAPVAAAYRIGCWYWETPDFPETWCDRFDLLDEVWAATEFVAQAIRAKATVPVAIMPPMVCPPALDPDRAWVRALMPEIAADEFVFLYQFDVASVPFRKNPEGTIEAFAQAFAAHEPVRLVVKLLNATHDPDLMARLRARAEGHRVSFLEAPLESLDRFRLLASIDAFVSLHRAEGFGLSIAESMAYGVPVVATGWSGNMDFTSPANAALVAFDLRPTDRPHGPYPAGTLWAEPRLDDAARQMRRIVGDAAWRREIAQAGAETIRAQFSAAKVGAAMRGRLLRVAASARAGSRPPALAPAIAAALRPASRSTARLSTVARDVLRFPGYYASRLPRLPALLFRIGAGGVVERVVVASTDATPEHKRQYTLGAMARHVAGWFTMVRRKSEDTR